MLLSIWPFKISGDGDLKLSRRNRIKLEYLHGVRELEKKVHGGSLKVLYRSYFRMVKAFFIRLLSLKKGLTWDEILENVREARFKEKVRDRIIEFIKKVPEEEYGGSELTEARLKAQIKEFKWIIKEI